MMNMKLSSSTIGARTAFCSLLILLAITSGCKKDRTQAPVAKGEDVNFTILAKSGISTTGKTSIMGNIGVSPIAATAITGFALTMDASNQFSTSPFVTGKVYASDFAAPSPAVMTAAISNMEAAYTAAYGLTVPSPTVELNDGNIGGHKLKPGIYKWSTGVLISAAGLTLSGGPEDKWVFQIGNDLTLSGGAKVKLTGGALAKNITWVVAGQAVLGTESHLCGTVFSKTLISMNTGATVSGKLFAQTAVTLNSSTVVLPD